MSVGSNRDETSNHKCISEILKKEKLKQWKHLDLTELVCPVQESFEMLQLLQDMLTLTKSCW